MIVAQRRKTFFVAHGDILYYAVYMQTQVELAEMSGCDTGNALLGLDGEKFESETVRVRLVSG